MEYPSAFGKSFSLKVPQPLGEQAIRVVAPSGPFSQTELQPGLEWLARYPGELRIDADLSSHRQGFFAASDEERREQLQAALDEEGTGLIVIARGGYGLSRIIEGLDFTHFKKHPKWILGFSDATVLHLEVYRQGIASLHGPNGTTLGKLTSGDLTTLERLLTHGAQMDCLSLRTANVAAKELLRNSSEEVVAPLIGGNLTVLLSEMAAGRVPHFGGAFLALEDVTETSYRVDRMLVALRQYWGGRTLQERPRAVIFGEFSDCSPGRWGVTVDEVLREFADELGLPVLTGLPFGHAQRNQSFIHGLPIRVFEQ